MSFGVHPYSSKLQYSVDGIAAYTDLGSMKDIDPPTQEISTVKITHLQSPNRFHEYTFGMGEGGEVACDFFFNKVEFALFVTFEFLTQFYQVLFPLIGAEVNNSKLVFTGFLTKLDFDNMVVDADDAIMCPAGLKVSGKPIFTQGS